MITLKLICLITTLAGTLMIISYESFAKAKGWPIGNYFKSGSWLTSLGFLLLLSAGFFAFKDYSWWQGLLIILISWTIAFITCTTLKMKSQMAAAAITLIGMILYFISFSEKVS